MLPSVAVSVCPDSAELTITILGLAVLMALVAGMVGHGVLRPLLEARGIAPWRLRDSLGSMPLVLLGSALVGGTAAAFAVWGVSGCDVAGWVVMITSAKMIAGVVMMRLGLLALRKLV